MSDPEHVFRTAFIPPVRGGFKAAALAFAAAGLACGATVLANVAYEKMSQLTDAYLEDRRQRVLRKRRIAAATEMAEVKLWRSLQQRKHSAASGEATSDADEDIELLETMISQRHQAH